MSSAILLSSGGLDSTTVAYQLVSKGCEVIPIFFDYGQHCAEVEKTKWAQACGTISFRPLK